MRYPFLLNWRVTPYHLPILVAQQLGYYRQFGLELELIEPDDPSEVTKMIGRNEVPWGLKAMIHCFAARDRGYPIQSFGTLFDEPPTGVISLQDNKIAKLEDIVGQRIGYIGEFGKIMIDYLAQQRGIDTNAYTTVRVGMDTVDALLNHRVDAAIGLSCYQQILIEMAQQPTHFLRLDYCAGLGCCCFCSILMIGHQDFLAQEPNAIAAFMQATLQGVQLTREQPEEALRVVQQHYPVLSTSAQRMSFYHCLPFFSKTLENVPRDWRKVSRFAKDMGILAPQAHDQDCYTNQWVPQTIECDIA